MGPGPSLELDVDLNTVLTREQRGIFQNSHRIQEILRNSKSIAIIGLSTEKTKASNMVASYLLDEGYSILPVHPKATQILGQDCCASLDTVSKPVDVVNVFRPPAEHLSIVESAIKNGTKVIWFQLRLINYEAAQVALDAGLTVILDKCIKMEHARYNGGLHWAGMNTQVISARKQK